jgi:hypothetical protein
MPGVHTPLQQFLSHDSPLARHGLASRQRKPPSGPAAHEPEQQSASTVHALSSLAMHRRPPQTPLLQAIEQHSCGPVHAVPSGAQ